MSFIKPFWNIQTRSIHQSIPLAHKTSKTYHRLSKYVRQVQTNEYQAGEEIVKGMSIPESKPELPVYQFESRFFKRQNRGLYGGLQRRTGHTCSEAENKNKRTFLPNIVNKRLWSEALNKAVKLRVSTKVLKTITKEGGLDEYLTKESATRVKTLGLKGWELKYKVLKGREFSQLPTYGSTQVYYIHGDGKEIIVPKGELLEILYSFASRDSYVEINHSKFIKESSLLDFSEIVNKLENYGFDFTPIVVSGEQKQKLEQLA